MRHISPRQPYVAFGPGAAIFAVLSRHAETAEFSHPNSNA
jgi:hypothetical protein